MPSLLFLKFTAFIISPLIVKSIFFEDLKEGGNGQGTDAVTGASTALVVVVVTMVTEESTG